MFIYTIIFRILERNKFYMKEKIDMHIHTIASDGSYSAKEILFMSQKSGINTISITDHDTFAESKKALLVCSQYNINVIPGIELTAEEDNTIFHILGYYIDFNNPELNAYLLYIQECRVQEILHVIKKLKQHGISINVSSVIKEFGSLNTTNISKWICSRNKELSPKDIYKKYFIQNGLAYVRKEKIAVKEAIQLINASGGFAVWAHPLLNNLSEREFFDKLNCMIKWGLQGIEVYHPSQKNYKILKSIATSNNLFITGGSDFHNMQQTLGKAFGEIYISLDMLSFPTYTQKRK